MFIVTRTRTTAEPDENDDLVVIQTLESAHIEGNVEAMMERIRLNDHRMAGIRIFHMDCGDDGVPAIGTEVEP